jgi:hypothetical protein
MPTRRGAGCVDGFAEVGTVDVISWLLRYGLAALRVVAYTVWVVF